MARTMRRFALITLALAACGPAPADAPRGEASAEAGPPAPPAAATSAPVRRAKPASATATLPARFTALGNEPFWAAEVDGDSLVYKTPEDQAGTRVGLTRRIVGGTALLSGTLGGKPLVLTVRAATCSDGMSDRDYPYTVERALGGEVAQGCAKLD